jgi:RNA polymerase sigma factor (sigma-70 family)
MARSMARLIPVDVDDLISTAEEALVKTAHRYQFGTGASFAALAKLRIRGACLELARRRNAWHLWMDDLDSARDVPAPEDQPGRSSMLQGHRRLWDAVASLPPRSRTVIMLRYRWDMDTAEICAVVRLKPNRVNQIHRSAIEALKAVMEA